MRRLLILQIEIATEATKRAWDTNPDNVYGTLVVFLSIVCITFAVAIVMLWRSKEAQAVKMMEVIKDATKGFQDINNALSTIKEGETRDSQTLIEAIKTAKENVIQHINFLEERIKNRAG